MTARRLSALRAAAGAALASGLAVAVVPAPSAAVGASDVYVEAPENGGSDAHTCAQSDPCATVARAASVAGDGGTIHVGVGTFDGRVDAASALAIDGVSPEQTMLTAPQDAGPGYVVRVTAGATELSNLTISGGLHDGVVVAGTGVMSGHHVVLARSGCALVATSGAATLTDSRVEGAGQGCADRTMTPAEIVVAGGSVALTRTQVFSPPPRTPAVHVAAGTFTADQSYFDDSAHDWDTNQSEAVEVPGGSATVTRSTFHGFDTGVLTAGGTTVLADDTFQHNIMGVTGRSGSTTVVRSTFQGGLGALQYAVSVAGSIIGTHKLQSCVGGTVTDLGHNLATDHSCGLTSPTSRQDVIDLHLDTVLSDQGGPVPTVATRWPSAAVDAIPVGATYGDVATPLCPATGSTDLRGVPRPQGLACDAGSMELLATTTAVHAPATAAPYAEVTLDATVDVAEHGAGAEVPAGVVTFRSGATVLCEGTAVGGRARCTTTALAAGRHPLTAAFTPTEGCTVLPSDSTASTILVGTTPSFSTRRTKRFVVGRGRAVRVRVTGTPAPTITLLAGHLPAGLHLFVGDGRVVLAGRPRPAAAGTHRVTLQAANPLGTDEQALRIIVRG